MGGGEACIVHIRIQCCVLVQHALLVVVTLRAANRKRKQQTLHTHSPHTPDGAVPSVLVGGTVTSSAVRQLGERSPAGVTGGRKGHHKRGHLTHHLHNVSSWPHSTSCLQCCVLVQHVLLVLVVQQI